MAKFSSIYTAFFFISCSLFATEGPVTVKIQKINGAFTLVRDGKPYSVKGAGINTKDLATLKAHGGNSIRTWSIDGHVEPTKQLLDKAHKLGMTVSLGLDFGKERYGFDFDNQDAINALLAQTKERVIRFKDHPALLTWFIGNELNLNYTNSKVFDVVNDAATIIKSLDPHHPVTTTLAGFDRRALKDIAKRAPALDFVSFQAYGSLLRFPEYLEDYGYTKPFMVTEWGSFGHWEGDKTSWGAYIENTSTEKAAHYAKAYTNVIQTLSDQVMGSYVFLWGQKQEKTPTWYGMMLHTGHETEAMDVMHNIWTGKWPDNRAPYVSPITLNNKKVRDNVTLTPLENYTARITANDHDKDTLTYHWEVRYESTAKQIGGDREYIPDVITGVVSGDGNSISVTAPEKPGAYRLFVYVYDTDNNAGHANFPFYVQ